MRRLFTGSKKILLFSGIIGALSFGFFSFSTVFAYPSGSAPGAPSQIEVDPTAPAGSLTIDSTGDITKGVWKGTLIDMLYGGTGASYSTAAAVRTGLGIAKSGANTDISSINSPPVFPSINSILWLNPTGSVGIGSLLAPGALLSLGDATDINRFQVDSSGNIIKIRNVPYSWPATSGSAGTVLTNDGVGGLLWNSATPGLGGWTDDPVNGKITSDLGFPVGIGVATSASLGVPRLTVKPTAAGTVISLQDTTGADKFTINDTGTITPVGLVPWARLAFGLAPLPTARYMHSCAENSSTHKIYCFGGYDNVVGPMNQVIEYNPSTNDLSIKGALFPDITFRTSCAENSSTHKIYCFGGTTYSSSTGYTDINQIFEYNSVTNSLVVKTATLPTARYMHSCAENSLTHKIYCFGGYDGVGYPGIVNQIVEYNSATDTLITKTTPMPSDRYHASCAENSSTHKIYCFGGYSSVYPNYLSQIFEYTDPGTSPSSGSLVVKTATTPLGTWASSCADNSATGKIYCFGGAIAGTPNTTSQIFEYTDPGTSPSSGSLVIKTATLPTERRDHSCSEDSSTNKMYCLGGYDLAGDNLAEDVGYDPATDSIFITSYACPPGQLVKQIGTAITCGIPGGGGNGWTENVGTNTVYTTTSSRDVGMGTASPLAKLHVVPATGGIGWGPDQTPLQSTPSGGGANAVAGAADFSMGYKFTPTSDGQITELGARCSPLARKVSLYLDGGWSPLVSVDMSTVDPATWTYSSTMDPMSANPLPFNVTAGTSYVVAVESVATVSVTSSCVVTNPPLPPGSICPPPPPPPPPPEYCKATFSTAITSGDITINESRYNIGYAGYPYTADTANMWGQADFVFQKDISTASIGAIVESSVGIEATPSGTTKLKVEGKAYSQSGGLKFPDATVQTTAALTGSSGTSNALVKYSTPSSVTNSLLSIDNGNVGIGVGLSPSQKLHVSNGIVTPHFFSPTSGLLTNAGIFASGGGIGGTGWVYAPVQAVLYSSTDSTLASLYGRVLSGSPASGLLINQASTGNIAEFERGGVAQKWGLIDNNGNLGVSGTPITSVNAKLEVTNSTSNALRIKNSTGSSSSAVTFTQVSSGNYTTCGLVSGTGAIQCWGENTSGELGNGTVGGFSPIPVDVLGITGAIQVAVGYGHACALFPITGSPNIKCWGNNGNGQAGMGSITGPIPTPGPFVVGITNATQISAALENYTCALVGGTVKCWGENGFGQFGNGGTAGAIPTPVNSFTGVTTALQVTAGNYHTCVLVSAGTVSCAGYGAVGQLGNGGTANSATPVAVTGLTNVSQIANGVNFSCAIQGALLSGSEPVYCWGTTPGNGSAAANSVATLVTTASNAAQITGGGSHTCTIVSGSGTMECWGLNIYGELGNGTTASGLTPPGPVTGISTANQIDNGSDHSCAVISGGIIKCWGRNNVGQLGNGTLANSSVPISVIASGGSSSTGGSVDIFPAVGTGASQTGTQICQAAGGSTAICLGGWDSTGSGGSAPMGTLSQTVSGLSHTCALTTAGTVWCWGFNSYGQLGNSTNIGTGTPNNTPSQVTGITTATGISAGDTHTCAILSGSNNIRCWGNNQYGQLGSTTNSGTTTPNPTPLTTSGSLTAIQVMAGGNHTCVFISGASNVRCWGLNQYGQLGSTTNSGTMTPNPSPLSVGGASTTENPLKDQGMGAPTCSAADYNMGYKFTVNTSGTITQLGIRALSGSARTVNLYNSAGSIVATASVTPTGSSTWVYASISPYSVTAGNWYVVAVRSSGGTSYCYNAKITPYTTTSSAITVNDSRYISASSSIPFSVDTANMYGQADVTFSSSTSLTATQITAGTDHTCALLSSSDNVRCWGRNLNGQLGSATNYGTSTPNPSPLTTSGSLTATSISAGFSHTCAMLSGSNNLRCWGYNGQGQLGNGSTTQSSTPVTVSGSLTATQVSAHSNNHSCALLSGSNNLRCWGYNLFGQLGNSSTTQSTVPVTVSGSLTASQIAVGGDHACAALSDSTIKCWGLNQFGQLGNTANSGTGTANTSPLLVTNSGIAGGGLETPLQTSGSSTTVGSAGSWNMGYEFIPLVNGTITKLGVRCDSGTRSARLYSAGGTVLSSPNPVSVATAGVGTWNYTTLGTPVSVTAGTPYFVAIDTSGNNYCTTTIPSTSFTTGNITIVQGWYNSGGLFPGTGTAMGTTIYGSPDITFTTAGAGGGAGCSTSVANGRAMCADFGD